MAGTIHRLVMSAWLKLNLIFKGSPFLGNKVEHYVAAGFSFTILIKTGRYLNCYLSRTGC